MYNCSAQKWHQVTQHWHQQCLVIFFLCQVKKKNNNENRASSQPLKNLFSCKVLFVGIFLVGQITVFVMKDFLIHTHDLIFFSIGLRFCFFCFVPILPSRAYPAVIAPSSEILVECQLSKLFNFYHFLPWIVPFVEFSQETLVQSMDEGQGSLSIQ